MRLRQEATGSGSGFQQVRGPSFAEVRTGETPGGWKSRPAWSEIRSQKQTLVTTVNVRVQKPGSKLLPEAWVKAVGRRPEFQWSWPIPEVSPSSESTNTAHPTCSAPTPHNQSSPQSCKVDITIATYSWGWVMVPNNSRIVNIYSILMLY